MSTALDIPIVDRPAAGTWCAVCKAAGHFCQATCYSGFGEDQPYCEGCDSGVPCARNKALEKAVEDFEPESRNDAAPAPVKVIPKEEWPADTAIHEKKHDLADVPFGIRSEVRAEQNTHWKREFLIKNFVDYREFIGKLSSSLVDAVHHAAIMAVDPSWFVVEEGATCSRILLDDPIFHPNRDTARALAVEQAGKFDDADYHLMIWHSGKKIPAVDKNPDKSGFQVFAPPLCGCGRKSPHAGTCSFLRKQREVIPKTVGSGRKPGDNYKQPQRDAAAELLQAGKSIREAAAEVGLSKNKVIEVKKATPDVPEKANSGGAPTHKPKGEFVMESSMDQEVSVERRESVKVSTRTSSGFGSNPVLVALLQYLPPPGEEFTVNQRVKWLNAAISMFELLYTAPDSEDWMLTIEKMSLK
jgi:hypothetical protein